MLSVLAVAKSVPLFFKFANDCRCCLEVNQGLKRMWFPSSDRRGRGPVSGVLSGVWVSLKSSQGHQVLSQMITLKMWQGQALSPQGYVCFQMWNSTRKMGTFLSFFLSVLNGSRKEEEEFTHPKNTQKPFEVLKWSWSRLIGSSPLPRCSSHSVPLYNGEVWYKAFNPQMQLQREGTNPSFYLVFLLGIYDFLCQWQKVLQAELGKGPGQGIGDKLIQTLLSLIPMRVLLQVT